ncbi:MAG: hypothetical protein M3R31_00160 [Pseudomonadota bacterium]|nr:hypothetical protein [Pseudomonadota bacterium]
MERAIRLYRKRISRCRTENQVNLVHIALENYITPDEVRYLGAALADDPADSPSGRWIARLRYFMPTEAVRPVEFERRGVRKGMTRYTADIGSPAQKTLILGFASKSHRLMLPMHCLLGCLDPALYDVIVLRDFSRRFFSMGIPGLGEDFFETLSNLRHHADLSAYRNSIALGTSSGGLPALLAAIQLRLDRGISIGGVDFPQLAARLRRYGVSEEPYAELLASRPDPFPELLLVYSGGYAIDEAAASALHQCVPSQLWPVKNSEGHAVLAWKFAQRRLPAFLSNLLGQSVEHRDPPEAINPKGRTHDR